jgi:hypothetical protein
MKKTLDTDAIMIYEDGARHFGADQHWYTNKLHGLSGCGPTTAALIMMYMAAKHPCCSALYQYGYPAEKNDFIAHMDSVRQYVRPGAMGLTDAGYFASSTAEFAKPKGVQLNSKVLPRDAHHAEAFSEIKEAIDKGLMPALLILRNPSQELDDFTWHWMAVTGYEDEKGSVFVSTYAKEFELQFYRVWVQYKPYHADVVIFYPGER